MSAEINIGIVADWLVTYAGSEKVIKEFIDVFPSAELYSVVDFYLIRIENYWRERMHILLLFKICLSQNPNTRNICL